MGEAGERGELLKSHTRGKLLGSLPSLSHAGLSVT